MSIKKNIQIVDETKETQKIKFLTRLTVFPIFLEFEEIPQIQK